MSGTTVPGVQGILNAGNYPQPNPLGMIGQYATIANQVAQNKLLGAELPRVQAETSNIQTQGQAMQQQLAVARANRSAQVTYSLLNLPDTALQGGGPIHAALDQELALGTIDQKTHDLATQSLPPPVQADGSPTPGSAYRQNLTSHLIATLTGPDAFKTITGGTGTVDQGLGVQGVQIPGAAAPNAGALIPQGQPIQTFPSRAQQMQREPFQSGSTPGTVPIGSITPSNLTGQPGVPGTPSVGAPAPVGRTGANGGPLPPGSPAPRLAPVQTAQTGAPPGFAPTGMPVGSDIPLKVSQEQYAAAKLNSGQFAQQMWPLVQAQKLLSDPNVDTGAGSEAVHEIKSIILAQSPDWLKSNNINSANVASAKYDELQKYLTQIINSNPMAAGSDARLSSALTGSPSVHINQMAGQNVVTAMIGLRRMEQAAVLNYKGDGSDFSDYMSKYSSKVDPRGFISDLQSPQQKADMLDKMKPAEKANYLASVRLSTGLTNTPTMPAPGQ